MQAGTRTRRRSVRRGRPCRRSCTPGSHLRSGAVVNPRSLQRLFKGRKRIDELPLLGEVHGESVLFLTRKRALRIPTPPTMVNHRNYVASLSQLGKFLADEAEELGV